MTWINIGRVRQDTSLDRGFVGSRRLRRVQPPFGGIGEAALLGYGNEITKVAELHWNPIPIKYA